MRNGKWRIQNNNRLLVSIFDYSFSRLKAILSSSSVHALVSLSTFVQAGTFSAFPKWLRSVAPEHRGGNTPAVLRVFPVAMANAAEPLSAPLWACFVLSQSINRESLWASSCVCSTLAYSSAFLQPQPDLQLRWWTPRFWAISNTHLDASDSFR